MPAGAVAAATAGRRAARRRQAGVRYNNAQRKYDTTAQMEFKLPTWAPFGRKEKDISTCDSASVTESVENQSDATSTLQQEGLQFKFPKFNPPARNAKDISACDSASVTSGDSKSSVLSRLKQQAQDAGGFFKKKQQALVKMGIKMTSGTASEQQIESSGANVRRGTLIDAGLGEKRASWVNDLEQMGFERVHIQEAIATLGSQAKQIEDVVQLLVATSTTSPVSSGGASSSDTFSISLKKGPFFRLDLGTKDPLGVVFDASGPHLTVEHIGEGLVSTWNEANPNLRVKAGDRITEVNGTRGNPQELHELLTSASSITMCISGSGSKNAMLVEAEPCTVLPSSRRRPQRRVSFSEHVEVSEVSSALSWDGETSGPPVALEETTVQTALSSEVGPAPAEESLEAEAKEAEESLDDFLEAALVKDTTASVTTSASLEDAVAASESVEEAVADAADEAVAVSVAAFVDEAVAASVEEGVAASAEEACGAELDHVCNDEAVSASAFVEEAVAGAGAELETEMPIPELAAKVVEVAVLKALSNGVLQPEVLAPAKYVEQESVTSSPKKGGA